MGPLSPPPLSRKSVMPVNEGSTIEFDLGIEDLVAFGTFHFRNSPTNQRMRRRGALATAAAVFVGLALLALVERHLLLLIPGFILAPLAALAYRAILPGIAKRYADRAYREGRNATMTGWHRLTLTDDGLLEENSGGRQFTNYGAIERIAETGDHIFTYNSAVSAYVIPKRKVSAESVNEFRKVLEAHVSEPRHN